MATVQIVSREASDILSRKFSDLADDPDYDPIEPYVTPRDSARSRFPFSPHPRLLHDDIDVYPSSFSSREYLQYLDDDSYIASMTPLRAERILQMKTTPFRGLRQGSRVEIRTLRHNLKNKFLHLCGASKAMFSSKYVGLPV